MSANMLIIDDDKNIIHSFKRILRKEGYLIFSALNGEDGLSIFTESKIDIALVDYHMPGMNGIETLKKIKIISPKTDVIIVTGYGTIQSAVEALKLGAYDYITKPLNSVELRNTLNELITKNNLIGENERLRHNILNKHLFHGIVAQSPSMLEIFHLIEKVSDSISPVLIQGESGTGKEMIAQALHKNSVRSNKSFVVIDCSAMSTQVIESELFGHVKGAFTNAINSKIGLLEEANGGTVFIDEITEIPIEMQAKFLRAIQEKEIRQIGSTLSKSIDIKIIAATNKNIDREVENGKFRLDLYYRLNVVPIFIPPLRERIEDISLLIKHFMNEFRKKSNRFSSISQEALKLLMNYSWPGNVRELRNVIERIFVLKIGDVIEIHHLPQNIMDSVTISSTILYEETLENIKKIALKKALKKADGNKILAAKQLGIGKSTLYRKIKLYKL